MMLFYSAPKQQTKLAEKVTGKGRELCLAFFGGNQAQTYFQGLYYVIIVSFKSEKNIYFHSTQLLIFAPDHMQLK